MSDTKVIADLDQRLRALDPGSSFIVQAPAGSGKTGLLVQRVIRLLSLVDAPEEIIAITFTKKAAGEMRERIIKAFSRALNDEPPEKDHERLTWELSRVALARNRELQWGLLENPGRLRIQTIDSFCSSLARQMPLLSRFGAVPAISEDSAELYREAARNTIAELESGESWSSSIEYLVRHLDNRLELFQGLISTMLARRDQWLRHVANREHPRIDRKMLEGAFARFIEEKLSDCQVKFPPDLRQEILELVEYAISNLQASGNNTALLACENMSVFPTASAAHLSMWKGLACMLLTADGKKWRSKVDARNGFPPESGFSGKDDKIRARVMKARMHAVLESLSTKDAARQALARIAGLPEPEYSDEEWQTLASLFEILRISAASLEVVFREKGQVDFTAMSQAALLALGDPGNPTDLALALDYRIQHILVDEFQDTSWNQYELLKRLTAGWQPGDGRSLFLVGDPMQSIYRFREAEVGLFLEAWRSGIGSVVLEPLQLNVNFRSQEGVVDWVNRTFSNVLPPESNIASGAVRYARSVAFHDAISGKAASVHAFFGKDYTAEAQRIIEIIRDAQAKDPEGSIAILVRGRNHLVDIVRLLKQGQIRFRAIEIESLAHRPVIKDLLSLTRALLNPADRVAWLAILRAPWCGLALEDLEKLVGDKPESTVLDLLSDPVRLVQLSPSAQVRLQMFLPPMERFFSFVKRSSLRAWVENCWYSLGGPACVPDETDIADAEEYFSMLERLEQKSPHPDVEMLGNEVARLFALPDILADEKLQVMTMHKSKGLEFDTVILPGLARRTGSEDSMLMNWIERPLEPDGSDLLLAPIKQTGQSENARYRLLSDIEKEKSAYENGRLLYVAATRARKYLHLLGNVGIRRKQDEVSMGQPVESSLLFSLWPLLEQQFQDAFDSWVKSNAVEPEKDTRAIDDMSISRLTSGWKLPSLPESIVSRLSDTQAREEQIEFSWAGEMARHVGTVVHRYLQKLGETGVPSTFGEIQKNLVVFARQALVRQGVAHSVLDSAIGKVEDAIKAMLSDPRGRWILHQGHTEIQNEYPLTCFDGKNVYRYVIDRTFRDGEGTRWIIDYKTGVHQGSGLEEFLDREVERYRPQLDNYARLISNLESGSIRLGLYFPLMHAWREWGYRK